MAPPTKNWAVVQFAPDTNNVQETATVPSKWLKSNELTDSLSCYWPRKQPRKHIQKCTEPNSDSWILYPITEVRLETDNYDEAIHYEKTCSGCSSESDYPSQLTTARKRKPKLSQDYISEISDDEEKTILPSPPRAPLLSSSQPHQQCWPGGSSIVENSTKNNSGFESATNNDVEELIDNNPNHSPKSDDTLSMDDEDDFLMPPPNKTKVLKTKRMKYMDIPPRKEENQCNNNSETPIKQDCCCEHVKIILRNVVAIRTLIDEQNRVLENNFNITASANISNTVQNFDKIPKKPFKSYGKLLKYEECLKENDDDKKQLEVTFYISGGCNSKEMIRRGLSKLFSNKLARRCSWTGRKENFPLQHLVLIAILKDAVRKRFSSLTDKEYEAHVATWFRQAQLRYTRQQKGRGERRLT